VGFAASRTAPFGQVQRASVILALADGASNAVVAREASRCVYTVRAWRKRFSTERMPALVDRPHPLARPELSATDKLRMVPRRPPSRRGAATVWTHRLLAEPLNRTGLAVSSPQVAAVRRRDRCSAEDMTSRWAAS
jgi:transposase